MRNEFVDGGRITSDSAPSNYMSGQPGGQRAARDWAAAAELAGREGGDLCLFSLFEVWKGHLICPAAAQIVVCGFWFWVPELPCSLLNFCVQVSSEALVRLPGSNVDSVFWFLVQIPV